MSDRVTSVAGLDEGDRVRVQGKEYRVTCVWSVTEEWPGGPCATIVPCDPTKTNSSPPCVSPGRFVYDSITSPNEIRMGRSPAQNDEVVVERVCEEDTEEVGDDA